MRIIDLNKHIQEYIKIFGIEYVSNHIKKLFNNFNNKQGDKNNATSKKKT